MAVQVASLYGVLSLDDSDFRNKLGSAGGGLAALGQNLTRTGGNLMAAFGPGAAVFGAAFNQAMNFDEAVTNTGAVLGYNREQIEGLKGELLAIGTHTRAGPQAIAESFYDIAGGVADASTHMSILNAAIQTSQAGNANLRGTTMALISAMNAYRFGADQAGYASNVLTQTVNKGVGTMDQFASALPQVAGIAAHLGIPLEDVGNMMAFITTKGNTASEAGTQLGAIMSALMKPNQDMKDSLTEAGFASGELAINQLGLVGALLAVANTATAHNSGMAAILGTQEAVRGSVTLMGTDFDKFTQDFKSNMTTATSAAQATQMGSVAAQFDLLKSQISATAIVTGNALVPAMQKIWQEAQPIIDNVTKWISLNPELTAQIGMLFLVGSVLGGGMIVLGAVISGVGTVVGGLTTAITFLLSPVGLLIAGIAGIVFAANSLYPGGLAQLLRDAGRAAQELAFILLYHLNNAAQTAATIIGTVVSLVQSAIDKANQLINTVRSGLGAYQGAGQNLNTAVGMVSSGQVSPGQFIGALFGAIGSEIRPRAGGGDVSGGMPYLVGERGAELFMPSGSGHIYNAEQTQGMGGVMINGNIVIQANSREEGWAAMDGALSRARARGL